MYKQMPKFLAAGTASSYDDSLVDIDIEEPLAVVAVAAARPVAQARQNGTQPRRSGVWDTMCFVLKISPFRQCP